MRTLQRKAKSQIPDHFFRWLAQRLQFNENGILLALAVCVGLGTGASVYLFRRAIEEFEVLFLEDLRDLPQLEFLGDWSLVVVLAIAGLVVGLIVHFFVGEERHHGVAGIMESVALGGGRLPYRKSPFKALAAAISLGGGASVGPEDPSVQIGSNLGSLFGQQLGLTEERVRLLVAAGAASAIAAAFNAPIAGVFFALEVVLGNFATSSVGVVVLAAVMSSVFTQSVEHAGPELGIRNYTLGGPSQIPFYILLGLFSGLIAAAFIRVVYWQRDLWHHWHVPVPVKTVLAGIIVGAVGVYRPEILGAGRGPMNEVLNTGSGDFTIKLLLLLTFLKLTMTSISMAGEFVGGIFAPALFTGAMLGGAYGRIVENLFPNLDIGDPAAYAIAGMAAMMAGIVRAPITAILLIFELTNNYQLILPIMLATVVTILVTERFEKDGIYHKALRRAGVHIQHGRDVDVMQSVMVREVMHAPAPVISPKATLAELRDALRKYQTKGICVVTDRHNRQHLEGIVTLTDLQVAYENARQSENNVELYVGDIATKNVITITPDEPVFVAIQRMGRHDFGHLPVVAADDDRALIGLLTRHDVMRSYNIAIARKWESQYQQQQIRLSNLVDEKIIALKVPSEALIVGKQIKEVSWPHESVVVSIRRGNKVILPHGSTVIQSGDQLTIVAEPECESRLIGVVNAPTMESMKLKE